MTDLTKLIEELSELEKNATPGPWFDVNEGSVDEPMMSVKAARIAGQPPRHEVALCATGDSHQAMENANAKLIATFRNAWPEIEKALRDAERYRWLTAGSPRRLTLVAMQCDQAHVQPDDIIDAALASEGKESK